MVRRSITVVVVALAVLLTMVAWREWRERQRTEELRQRSICPADIGAVLPDRDVPASPDAPAGVVLTQVADLEQPVALATRPGDPALYVAEQTGRVVRVEGDEVETVIDLEDQVATGTEQGLLGLAFSPDGRRAYTNHNDLEGDTHITEWTIGQGPASNRRDVLIVEQPHRWHNGGQVTFGPDGHLYIGLGDGGGMADPWRNGQDLDELLGKILRIDPRPDGEDEYSVPEDNPFVGRDDARPEVWAYGLRNPWRFSFDAETDDLWIADVGDACFEELDLEKAGSERGANYGWRLAEGSWIVDEPPPDDYVPPVYTYRRDGATTCAVVGGYVYRGTAIPGLEGWYLFGDFCHGHLMAWRGPGTGDPIPLGVAVNGLSSFGVDEDGEIYALSLVGEVFRLEPAP